MLRSKQVIFVAVSPKHGGTKARRLLESLGVTNTEDSFDLILRVASEDELQHVLGQLQTLDARKVEERESIISICGVVSGMTLGTEIVE